MSDETRAELEVALAAHMADEHPGTFLTHWVVMGSGSHPERPGRTQYLSGAGDETPAHAAIGLAIMLQSDLENDENYEDEDD